MEVFRLGDGISVYWRAFVWRDKPVIALEVGAAVAS